MTSKLSGKTSQVRGEVEHCVPVLLTKSKINLKMAAQYFISIINDPAVSEDFLQMHIYYTVTRLY